MASTTETTAPKTDRFAPLSDAESVWVAANARPALSPCLCGCGGETKGRFVPGHDALLKERLRATIGDRGSAKGSAKAQRAAKAALVTFGW